MSNNIQSIKDSLFKKDNFLKIFYSLENFEDLEEYNQKLDLINYLIFEINKEIIINFFIIFKKFLFKHYYLHLNILENFLLILLLFPNKCYDIEIFSFLENLFLTFNNLNNEIIENLIILLINTIKNLIFKEEIINLEQIYNIIMNNKMFFKNFKYKKLIIIIRLYILNKNKNYNFNINNINEFNKIIKNFNNKKIFLIIFKDKIKNNMVDYNELFYKSKNLNKYFNDNLLSNDKFKIIIIYKIFIILLKKIENIEWFVNNYLEIILTLINKLFIVNNTSYLRIIYIIMKRNCFILFKNNNKMKEFLNKNLDDDNIKKLNNLFLQAELIK